jgi:DNA processing protein
MSDNESLRDRLIAYTLIPWMTPARCRLLRETFESWTDVGRASATFLQTLLQLTETWKVGVVRDPLRAPEMRRQVASVRRQAVTLLEDSYPPLLKEIIDPPLALFYAGDLSLAAGRTFVAVVGSRKASEYGRNAALHLTRSLASAGAAIVSGLALGIDAVAHRAALDAGAPTIAVLGTGIDIIYPKSHGRLFRAIAEHGLILTEFGPGTPPLPPHFPIRNRVISGLSHGTVIVEATTRSGSLITARMAAEQNREVFAVPGPIFSAGFEGTHRLIQYGVKLVHDADDILSELPGKLSVPRAEREEIPPELASVLAVFRKEEATTVDDAASALHVHVATLAEPLLQLELGGWVRAVPGGRFVRQK